ncbi:MAG TPA: ribosome-associated translation inhibitor RaiA [Nitrolancea sp.]|jgi:putative sigma-54 modulation protein|nr:ribosome-associated translation inhibitor RaiA [Nitrolancea sp.]
MDLQIKTRNLHLTDSLDEYIQRKYQKLEKLNVRVIDAKLELGNERKRSGGDHYIAQLTIATKDAILRAEETNGDLRTTIDLAINHMDRQIRRFHDKKVYKRRRQSQMAHSEAEQPILSESAVDFMPSEDNLADDDAPIDALVRRKRFKLQPMDEDEAIEQMELLGHDFFVFYNPDEAQINVLYRRRDGQYGLILPELA